MITEMSAALIYIHDLRDEGIDFDVGHNENGRYYLFTKFPCNVTYIIRSARLLGNLIHRRGMGYGNDSISIHRNDRNKYGFIHFSDGSYISIVGNPDIPC